MARAAAARDAEMRRQIVNMAFTSGMREKDLQECVRKVCLYLQIPYYHTYSSRRSPEGFVDVVAITPDNTLLLYELKTAIGTLTPAQRDWQTALARVQRVESGVWRPADWISGRIEAALRGAR